jgi:uncharacterized membrane protein
MNDAPPPSRTWLARNRYSLIAWTAVTAILAATLGSTFPDYLAAVGRVEVRPHWPDAENWAAVPLKVQAHVIAALAAFGIGLVLMLKPKGTGLHRTLGWAWAAAMAATAITSLFFTELNGAWSYIHLFSGWTIVALPLGLVAIRRGRVRTHRGIMTGLFTGGLVVAGALAFMPGRLMWRLFFG